MPGDEAIEIRRIEMGQGASVWVPVTEAGATRATAPARAGDDPPKRAWRVRPAALALAGALALAALLRIGATPAGLLGAGLLAVLAVLAVIDLEVRLLPNRIVVPAIAAVLAWQLAFLPGRLGEAVLAGVAAAAFLLVPSLLRGGSIGGGDVKLAALLGAALGGSVVVAVAVASLAVWPVALVALVRGRPVRGARIPFGPFLAFGAAVVVLI